MNTVLEVTPLITARASGPRILQAVLALILVAGASVPALAQRRPEQLPRLMIATFQAADGETVHRFHEAVLAAGGRDNGAPGERAYHPGYYSAYALDPDGNNVEAVYHGPAKRSAASVEIEPA